MDNPNEIQVAGDHYKRESERGNPQHWDLVSMYGWDYFQGQITKYLMRWKYKHKTPEARLEDLKKARHFLDKYIALQETELAEFCDKVADPVPERGTVFVTDTAVTTEVYNSDWGVEGWYGDGTIRYKCRKCKREVVAGTLPSPHGCL